MNLLIVSAMPHHMRGDIVVGWGPTVRELDQLATRFERVRHIGCLHTGPPRDSDLPYAATNIELVPVPPSGGDGLVGKLDVLRASPTYVRTILSELPRADFVHVRAPANIALIAILVMSARRSPSGRWFKYAGNWHPTQKESVSYTLQRWWLGRPWHRGIVTVNGRWPEQPPWVRTFYNPSLDRDALERGRAVAERKELVAPLRLLYVGRVETPKGAGRAIDVTARLAARGVDATLEIVGDGPERAELEHRVAQLDLCDRVRFLGWRSHRELLDLYEHVHISLLPTTASEGWPKVLSEGMAFGAVPVAGAVSSIPQYLAELQLGAAIPAHDLEAYVDEIAAYAADPARWRQHSRRAVNAAHLFTFDHYLKSIDELVRDVTASS